LNLATAKIAIVHDWLTVYGGAERVLEKMLACFPDADLYSVVDFLPPDGRRFIRDKQVHTSFVQSLPFARRRYRQYLSVMPLAVEQFDLSAYDLVISSSHAVAKGVLTGPDQLHICMCYSPMRYAWDLQHQYLRSAGFDRGFMGWLVKWQLHKLRLWDARTANGVDEFVAISNFIAARIRKTYRRDSRVIYPPVDTDFFELREDKETFYLTVSRLVPYKRVDLIVDAFSAMPDKRLIIIGDGPEMGKLRASAGSNVALLGYRDNAEVKDYMQRARAFVFAAEEDFGIVPLEAQACGTPVIAYARGGVLETVQGLDASTPSGVFFYEQRLASLREAVEKFESAPVRITPQACRDNALRFSPERFNAEFMDCVRVAWHRFEQGRITAGNKNSP